MEGGGVEIVWTVISGESLLESFEISNHPGFGPIAIIKAGGTPGTVRLKAMLVVNGEIACEADHEVRIRQYDQIEVRYKAFIPCEALKGPLGSQTAFGFTYLGGDHRTFDYYSMAYRAAFVQEVRASLIPPSLVPPFGDELVLPSLWPPFGQSTGYGPDDGEEVAGACSVALFPWATPDVLATLQANENNHRITMFGGQSPGRFELTFELAAGVPLVPFAPEIDAAVTLLITQSIDPVTGEQTATIHATGFHDQFPAHELYVQGLDLVLYDPIVLGVSPACLWDLIPGCELEEVGEQLMLTTSTP